MIFYRNDGPHRGMIMQISPSREFVAGRTGELRLGLLRHLGPARGRCHLVLERVAAKRLLATQGDTRRQPRGRHIVVSGFMALRGPAVDLLPI